MKDICSENTDGGEQDNEKYESTSFQSTEAEKLIRSDENRASKKLNSRKELKINPSLPLSDLSRWCEASSPANFSSLSLESKKSLHEKLSSPDRIKRNAMEVKRRQEEKQAAATRNREKIEYELQSKLRMKSNRVRRITEMKQRIRESKQIELEERLEKAEQHHKV